MQPCLVVDFREHSLFALLLTPEGEVVPCSQELGGVVTRYLSADVLLEPSVTERGDFDWEAVQELFAADCRPGFGMRRRRLGLLRPWELKPGTEAVVIQHPLQVLSSPAAALDRTQRQDLLDAAAALTLELLSPVFLFLAQRGLAASEMEAAVVVPAQAGSRAIELLRRIFRQAGFRRLGLLRREAAAALALLAEGSPAGHLVVDLEDDALHVHKVLLEQRAELLVLRNAGSRSLRGMGRSWLVQRIAAALRSAGRMAERTPAAALDRGLAGLCGGPYPAEVAGEPPLRLNRGMLAELFDAGLGEELAKELDRRLRPVLRDLDAGGAPLVTLGSALAIGELETMLVWAAGGKQPASVTQTPVRERCARGAAALLSWRAGGIGRQVEVHEASGLRIDSLRGGSIEVLPVERLPRRPGESRAFCQHLRVESAADPVFAPGQLVVNFLWGCNPDPQYSATVCTLALDLDAPLREAQPHLSLQIAVRRSRHGWLVGTASAALGGARDRRWLRFPREGVPPAALAAPELAGAAVAKGAPMEDEW
jgi:hypothetical protein